MRKGRQSKGSTSLEEFAASLGRTDRLPAREAGVSGVSGGKRKMDAREAGVSGVSGGKRKMDALQTIAAVRSKAQRSAGCSRVAIATTPP